MRHGLLRLAWRDAAAVMLAALATIALTSANACLTGCSGVPPGQVQNWKPSVARSGTPPGSGASTRPSVASTSRTRGATARSPGATSRPGNDVTPLEVLEESHKASTSKTVWCAVPGPGGKMIWVQVK